MDLNVKAIIDAHTHVFGNGLQGVRDLLALERSFGYQICNFLSCESMDDAAQNALGIYLKALAPENYVFGGLAYRYTYDFAAEAETLYQLGFDGMKLLEGKPTLRKQIGIALNDPRYDRYYAWLEQNEIPLVAHIADPEFCWDAARVPEWAVAAGYFYGDDSFVRQETLYDEMEDVLTRYPRLRVVLAHFYFKSADLDGLDAWLAVHPNVSLDIVAGTEMYFNFALKPDAWRAFFIKHQDRIIFGTDNMNHDDPVDLENARVINNLELAFLASDGDIPAWDKQARGISLPVDVQEKILRTNFLRLVHGEPRLLDRPAACRYLEARLRNHALALKPEERSVISDVLEYLIDLG